MKKLLLTCILLIASLVYFSCDRNFASLDPDMRGDFKFDIVGSHGLSAPLAKRLAGASDSLPFCNLSKFEIDVQFVSITLMSMQNTNEWSTHVLLNRANGDGIKVDLAIEKLSDKISLLVEEPIGIGLVSITVGIVPNVTVNGYINSSKKGLLRSTAAGFDTSAGSTEDYVMEMKGTWETLTSYGNSEDNSQESIKGTGLKKINLNADYKGGHHDTLQYDNSSTVEVKWPLDIAIANSNGDGSDEWRLGDAYWMTPYVEGQTVFEKYYLRRTGDTAYTDFMTCLFDNSGNVFKISVGIFEAYTHSVMSFTSSGPGCFNESDADCYDQAFEKLGNNAIRFRVSAGGGYSEFHNFTRGDHSGTMTINVYQENLVVQYDCIKVE
ncbi:MAG: hypothetical protein A2248_08920 [Candidatus Raymondbacteria bacterium RIFOXYA2_FULL_49_16]|nr:MAG: hypothetical protein A2248_08920 [Candidatus Raymondbacteria bacterium RIFOXYA2_FULL_49_16]OGP45605.1 MAG: hypothetical protein A2324_04520 [Candidatus Raymondbacteria bacterium RIFOXYB2_FULL_49_35]